MGAARADDRPLRPRWSRARVVRPRVAPPGRLLRVGLGIGLLLAALTPFSVSRSQARLNAAVDAIKDGGCTTTIDEALASIDALSVRAEPYELLAYCDARSGEAELAEQMARGGDRT